MVASPRPFGSAFGPIGTSPLAWGEFSRWLQTERSVACAAGARAATSAALAVATVIPNFLECLTTTPCRHAGGRAISPHARPLALRPRLAAGLPLQRLFPRCFGPPVRGFKRQPPELDMSANALTKISENDGNGWI